MKTAIAWSLATCLFAVSGFASPGHRRAVLVGINDYSASHTTAGARDLSNLNGAVNDVLLLKEMLVVLYGFERRDVVTLTDQEATRMAILGAIDRHLAAPASAGDVLLFYFAGHGSQAPNSLSDEADKLDETIVPADSIKGADDIRDKELRRRFNRILDRGARLTVILDDCHSGSGARGLPTGIRPRGIRPDRRDVRDGTNAGPRPEDRGALVLAAAQDFDQAWETRDDDGTFHGAFSWGLLRAMRDSARDESAAETFLRAQARLRAETPFQEPVMAGNAEARLTPLLGGDHTRAAPRTAIAVERVRSDGTVVLQGGWANGLSIGSRLRFVDDFGSSTTLTVTALLGLGRSEARMQFTRANVQTLRSGALLEIAEWAAPAGRPLRVWMPRAARGLRKLERFAQMTSTAAKQRGIKWISDPVSATATHLLRWYRERWELVSDRGVEPLGNDHAALDAVNAMPPGASLFVQLPAPAAMIRAMDVGPRTDRDGIQPTARPDDADYILTGRYSAGRLEYAWIRPFVRHSDRRKSSLPLRTDWIDCDTGLTTLRDAVTRLRKIQAWTLLDAPRQTGSLYHLGLRVQPEAQLIRDPVLLGRRHYELVLRASMTPLPPAAAQRYFYAFTIDSHGKGTLLFPRSGSVENHFPPAMAPPEISLGNDSSFEVTPPYGIDTYFLLTTDEPLPDPWILEWDGVRTRTPAAQTPLEELLMLTGSGRRSRRVLTPATWSIERVVFESVDSPSSPHKRNRSVSQAIQHERSGPSIENSDRSISHRRRTGPRRHGRGLSGHSRRSESQDGDQDVPDRQADRR